MMADSGMAEAAGAADLAAMIARANRAGKGLPPVDRWEPPFCGAIDMEIRGDGTWFYMGTPIGRPAMVELFSSVLRKDADGATYLVTPVEKVQIRVADAHFMAVELTVAEPGPGQRLIFRTNVGEIVEAGDAHPLRFSTAPDNAGLKPYLHVRGRLEALASRAVMHQLAALGEEAEVGGRSMFGVHSNGRFFPMMASDALAEASS